PHRAPLDRRARRGRRRGSPRGAAHAGLVGGGRGLARRVRRRRGGREPGHGLVHPGGRMSGASGSIRFGIIAGERLRRWEAACLEHLIVPWDAAPPDRGGGGAARLFARASRAWRPAGRPAALREVPKLAAPTVPE